MLLPSLESLLWHHMVSCRLHRVLSAALLNQVLSPQLIEGALVVVAGVMLSVSCRELLPQAIRKHGKAAAAGGLAGWLTMRLGLSLVKDHHS